MKISNTELENRVFEAKNAGLSDREIGERYSVNLRFIEKVVTKKLGVNVSGLNRRRAVKATEPKGFKLENTTVWSFKSRGSWATHNGDYRGNWSPYVPRNVILRYSDPGDVVLDYFCGAGTTGIECKLLGRNFIGLDINPHAVALAEENITAASTGLFDNGYATTELRVGDARYLSSITAGSVDLICAHPPYADIIRYTNNEERDLSGYAPPAFLIEMEKVACESIRVLKSEGKCAILIGDMRKQKNVIPLGFNLIRVFLSAGFTLKELIIKRQHNCKTTGFWYSNSVKFNFLLLAHEYLAIFEKPNSINTSVEEITVDESSVITPERISKETLESTTVWLSKPTNWLGNTLSNLITRYTAGDYLYIDDSTLANKPRGRSKLVVVNAVSPRVRNNGFRKYADVVEEGGYLAVITRDVRRTDGTLMPVGLTVEQELSESRSLKIKELIAVSLENDGPPEITTADLKISHYYVFVYNRTTEEK
jgi:DNA modification methylase